jgi:hypothetical protein
MGILQHMAFPISLGYSEREVAQRLGTTTRIVRACLAELRSELEP